MKRFIISREGKIKDLITDILFYGLIIFISFFLSRFGKLYFVTWLPIVWAFVSFCFKTYLNFTTSYYVNIAGIGTLVDTLVGSPINVQINWCEINKIIIHRKKTKIIALFVHTEKNDKNINLYESIENFGEFVNEILVEAKKYTHIKFIESQ